MLHYIVLEGGLDFVHIGGPSRDKVDRRRGAGVVLQFGICCGNGVVQSSSSTYKWCYVCGQPLPYVGGFINAADRCWRRSGREGVYLGIRAGHTKTKESEQKCCRGGRNKT